MRSKLGLIKLSLDDDVDLVMELLNTMESTGADFTNTFCCFLFGDASDFNSFEKSLIEIEENILKQCYPLEVLIKICKPDISSELKFRQFQGLMLLLNSNPAVLENLGRAGLAIRKLKRDVDKANKLEEMTPEDKIENDRMLWKKWLEKYHVRVKREMESSCDDLNAYNEERLLIMKNNNPRFILRNHIAQSAIVKAEKGDYSEVRTVLKLLETPYDHSSIDSDYNYSAENVNLKYDESSPSTSCNIKQDSSSNRDGKVYDKCPDWAFSLRVT